MIRHDYESKHNDFLTSLDVALNQAYFEICFFCPSQIEYNALNDVAFISTESFLRIF